MTEIDNLATNHARLREAAAIIKKMEPGPGVTEEDIREIRWQLTTMMARIKATQITTKLPQRRQSQRKQKPDKGSNSKQ